MSRVHLLLTKQGESDETVRYTATSPDLSADSEWAVIGTVDISLSSRTYTFIPSQVAEQAKLLSPEIWYLKGSDWKKMKEAKYADSSYGALSSKIHTVVLRRIEEDSFPDTT